MNESPLPTLADYCAAVDRFLGAIEAVLVKGVTIQNRYDQFCRVHGIRPGIGARALTADTLPPDQRYVHARILELTQKLYDEHLGPSAPQPPTGAAVRALGSRNRI